jgi:hypothetical protein
MMPNDHGLRRRLHHDRQRPLPRPSQHAEFKRDFAGIGGAVDYIRSTAEARTYCAMIADVVAVFTVPGSHMPAGATRNGACWIISRWVKPFVRGFAGSAPARGQPLDHQHRSARRLHVLGRTIRRRPFTFLPQAQA